MDKVKIGFPIEYEDENNIVRNGLFLRELEIKELEKRLKEINKIIDLEQQCKKQKEVIDKAEKYIENEMPYLQEIDKEYEDVNGNTYFTYKEYDGKELLDILKGEQNG